LIDQLTENPLLPAAGAGVIALLAGFGVYRMRQRKNAGNVDSQYLESRLQPDSFFGTSGGQRIDTGDSQNGSSSIVYSASQLDAADDVDPVAEADVYLAYGRDLQAEEILKEALKTHSGRLAVHQKLLEIYGKRRDTRNFELTANEAHRLTHGEGQDWIRICEQGQSIDPGNQLYLPGGAPQVAVGIPSQPAPLELKAQLAETGGNPMAVGAAVGAAGAAALTAGAALATQTMDMGGSGEHTAPMAAQAATASVDLDFDLDFSLDDENAKVITEMSATEATSKMGALEFAPPALDMDIAAAEVSAQAVTQPLPIQTTPPAPAASTLSNPGVIEFDLPLAALSKSGEVSQPAPLEPSLSLPSLDEAEQFKKEAAIAFGTTQSGALATFAPKAPEPAAAKPDAGLMEFNLGNLSLELANSSLPGMDAAASGAEDPLATKLALAEEFNGIGDTDGARALIEEVIADATGDLKAKAQKALAALA
jgi:pilus assembly protein FimV